MGKHLIKQNLRRCYKCKEIFELNSDNFYQNKDKNGGFEYRCKNCKRIIQQKKYTTEGRQKKYLKDKNDKKMVYERYRYAAKKRDLEWELTFEKFKTFWQKPCFYCGDKIETVGLDRVDNKKGYITNNIVSCCKTCNYMKGIQLKENFIKHCFKITTN